MLLLASCFSLALFAASPEDAVKQAEKDWATGIVKKDPAMLDKVLAPDLTYKHSTGAVDTKESYIAGIKSGKFNYERMDDQDVSVKVYGKVAVLWATANVRALSGGSMSDFRLNMLHIYVKNKAGWQLVAHQSSRLPQ
jgi:ketosteroid isomerase-like protein